MGAAFNGDETRILTWSDDGTRGCGTPPPARRSCRRCATRMCVGRRLQPDETRILTWTADGTARLWDAATGEEIGPPLRHEGVSGAVFNGDETRILTWSATAPRGCGTPPPGRRSCRRCATRARVGRRLQPTTRPAS